jgi:hypothetical protein
MIVRESTYTYDDFYDNLCIACARKSATEDLARFGLDFLGMSTRCSKFEPWYKRHRLAALLGRPARRYLTGAELLALVDDA